jgi:hypothetical protein
VVSKRSSYFSLPWHDISKLPFPHVSVERLNKVNGGKFTRFTQLAQISKMSKEDWG